jgi:glycine C-acetyltransferase/8-amino-7-oxononanoate synthase
MPPTSARIFGKNARAARGLRERVQAGHRNAAVAIISVIMPDLERGAAMWEALLHEGFM